MNRTTKLVLYVVCLIAVIVFGSITVSSYRQATKTSEQRASRIADLTSIENTNVTETTNTAPDTNLLVEAAATNTNVVSTNVAETNLAAAKKTTKKSDKDDTAEIAGSSSRGYTRMVTYGLG